MGVLPLPNPDALQDDEGWASTGLYRFLSSVEKEARGTATSVSTLNTNVANNSTAISNLQTLSTQKLTAGTIKTFTSSPATPFWDFAIPSWAKRITANYYLLDSSPRVQFVFYLGTSAGIDTSTNYNMIGQLIDRNTNNSLFRAIGSTAYFLLNASPALPEVSGTASFEKYDNNTWFHNNTTYSNGLSGGLSYTLTSWSRGTKTLNSELTTLRLSTTNGTSSIVTGSINILYE